MYVAIAALFLLFTSACSQEKIIPEQENGPQLSESSQIILGHVTVEGFTQTATESNLLKIMDTYRGEADDYSYTSASVVKNGSLYMIVSEVIRPDGTQGKVWMHLEVVEDDIVFDTQKPYTKVSCEGGCDTCTYREGSTCYHCECIHPFDFFSCEEFYLMQ